MLCFTHEDAEDATQEAMLVLFGSIGTLRSPAALAAWMFKIVRNECLRLGRRALRTSADAHELARATDEDPGTLRLRVVQLVKAVSDLPPDLREVFIMRDVRGFSGAETASTLGVSIGAMKTRLHRARARVRATLDAGGAGEP